MVFKYFISVSVTVYHRVKQEKDVPGQQTGERDADACVCVLYDTWVV